VDQEVKMGWTGGIAILLALSSGAAMLPQEEALDGDDLAPALTMASLLPEPADTCPDLRKEYEGKKIVLKNLEDGILGDLCGDEDDLKCTKVLITSDGPSAVLQGTRLGLYFLWGWNQHDDSDNKYPSYFRPVSQQYLYFMHEINGGDGPGPESTWEYWHTYDRWVIGPSHGKAWGGIMIKPYDHTTLCPWKLKWFRSQRWYHDVNVPNLWNPVGNPWKRDDSIFVHCYDEEVWPEFDCNCQRLNISSSARVQEYHPDRLGEYVRLSDKGKEGYLAPVYAAVGPGAPSYLYSHHPTGKVWTIGSSETTWSLRLNKLTSPEEQRTCPLDTPEDKEAGWEWEYLQSKKGEKEVWLRDLELKVECIDHL